MILLIDNYDSFVHNLARYARELGAETLVRRNDALTTSEIRALNPTHIVISPGPWTPAEAGISTETIRTFAGVVPILGVCLGHQCIAAAFGGPVVRAARPMHGKSSLIHHGGRDIFADLPSPFLAARYHSLEVPADRVPAPLEVLATTAEGEVMALRHRRYPVWGVQFHPESVLTQHGHRLLGNFLACAVADDTMPTADQSPPAAMIASSVRGGRRHD